MKNKHQKKYTADAAREVFNLKNYNTIKQSNMDSSRIVENFELSREHLIETPKISRAKKGGRASAFTSVHRGSDAHLPNHYSSVQEQKLMKCDIAALLKAIEEIEKRLRMEKILNKNEKEKEGMINTHEMDETTVKALRNQFSMLNFNRNYKSVKKALENSSQNSQN